MKKTTENFSFESAIHTWCDGRMSARPGYYSGRGPNSGDFGHKHMEMIHAGLLKDFGKEAAKQFVQFIANLGDMSATAFLVNFRRFYYGGMKGVIAIEQDDHDGTQLSGRGAALEGEAFGCLMSVMDDKRTPEEKNIQSIYIKSPFLSAHRDEMTPKQQRRSNERRLNTNNPFAYGF